MVSKNKAEVKLGTGKAWRSSWTETFSFYHHADSCPVESRGETKRLNSTKPCFPPRALETRMSHPPWGGCFYRLVAFDPFALRLANLPAQSLKKIWKGKQRGLYWEWCSWTAGVVSERKNFYYHVDIKSRERGTLFHKTGWNVAFYFRNVTVQPLWKTFLESH